MHSLNSLELESTVGGGDTFAKDAGQFLGGATGWVVGNPVAYAILGPGIGGLVAVINGLQEAQR